MSDEVARDRRTILDALGHESAFRALVDAIDGHAILLLDQRGRIVTWTRAAGQLTGFSESEAIGKSFTLFYPPEDVAAGRPLAQLEAAAAAGHAEEEGWRVRKDATRFWSAGTLTALRDDGGRVVGFASIARDATDRRAAELDRRALTRSNVELELFATVASHDLQEPLRKINSFIGLVLTRFGGALADEPRDYLTRAAAAAVRMQQLTEALLAYARVAAKGPRRKAVSLSQTVREVLRDLENAIDKAAASVVVDELPTVEADPTQMRQLFQNLIGNALKFRSADRAAVIRVGAVPVGADRVALHVTDNGIGFEQKYAERIFGVFQRLHRRTEYAGAGVGLAICRRIAESHGGTIEAVATPGAGADFIVTLPLVQPPEEPPQ